jgi:hypothetical protein
MNGSELPCGADYELRFDSLFAVGPAYAFPCDARGRVDMDALSERSRINYLYARAMVGRETALPEVRSTRTSATRAAACRVSAAIVAAGRLLAGALPAGSRGVEHRPVPAASLT